MFFSHISETKRLNQLDLASYEGKRVYYDKARNYSSLITKIACVLFFLVTTIFMRANKNEAALGFIFLMCLGGLLLVDSIFKSIGNLLLKNPVFILNGKHLFYLRTNQSYDILNYSFSDEYIGRTNYYGTFCMIDKKGKRIITEKNWHLKNEEEFKSHIKYNKFLLAKEMVNR